MTLYDHLFTHVATRIDPERAHHLGFRAVRAGAPLLRASHAATGVEGRPVEVMGLRFPHPLGLAAGFDKNAVGIDALGALGFGHVEIGTVTGLAQPGNPKPRLFRLPADRAVVNRFGFNSIGSEAVARNLAAAGRVGIPLGINLGRNQDTPNEAAAADYVAALNDLLPFADYIVVNVSSPNTTGLRALQESRALRALVEQVTARAAHNASGTPPPVLVKVSPDASTSDLLASVDAALEGGAAGVIATNTTVAREGLASPPTLTGESGGLSGAPLKTRATETCSILYAHLRHRVPIIGVGGIFTAADAYERIRAGASLVQVYTALIYEGPGLVGRIVRGLSERLAQDGFTNVSEAIGADVR